MAEIKDSITLERAPDIDIRVRRNARARRLSLRVSALDGRVTLTMPPRTHPRDAARFANEHTDWITAALAKQAKEVTIAAGVELPVDGQPRRVVAGAGRSARMVAAEISAPIGREGPAIQALLKALARARLQEICDRHARSIGKSVTKITLRDTRSRWGSCSADGNLMFSWRLILAPSEVLDYVAAHEVAHLAEMNHSPAFWQTVERLMPGYREPRLWLRRHGAGLHRFKFEGMSDADARD